MSKVTGKKKGDTNDDDVKGMRLFWGLVNIAPNRLLIFWDYVDLGKGPPGGWYGPFGMFRMITYVFTAIMLYGIAAMAWHIKEKKDWLQVSLDALLVLAAFLSALCAWSHEALMKMTKETEKQNKRYSKSLDKYASQIQGLKSVEGKLTELTGRFDINKLDKLLDTFGYLVDRDVVCDILDNLLQADVESGNKNMLLHGEELASFLAESMCILQKIPAIDEDEIKKLDEHSDKGVNLEAMAILTNAALVAHRNPKRSEALYQLFLFSMKPDDQQTENVMKYDNLFENTSTFTKGSLAASLEYCKSQAGDDVVPRDALRDVLQTFAFARMAGQSVKAPLGASKDIVLQALRDDLDDPDNAV